MGKRDHGTGGIYKRKDGTYTARIQVGKRSNGRPNKKAFYGKTEAEVKRKLREFRRNMDKYQPESVCRLTVTEYFYNWLLNNKRYNLKDTSYDRLERTIENQILPAIGNVLITQVISDDIQGLLNSLIDDKASYSVVKKTYYALNELFRFASLRGDIAKNPMLTIELPSKDKTVPPKPPRFFSERELRLILEELQRTYKNGKNVYFYPDAFVLILNTGLRMGELLALKWGDINLVKREIFVHSDLSEVALRDKQHKKKGYTLKISSIPKTDSGNRMIDIHDRALGALKALKKNSDCFDSCDTVVCNKKGDILAPQQLERTFRRVLRNAGIAETGVHSLRHTFASLLLQNPDTSIREVSEILGHANPTVTINIYWHLIHDFRKKATICRLDNLDI